MVLNQTTVLTRISSELVGIKTSQEFIQKVPV